MKTKDVCSLYGTIMYPDFDKERDRAIYYHKVCKTFPEIDKLEPLTNVLELGCGMGKFANLCDKKNVYYTGVDISEEEVKFCKSEFPHYNFYNWDIIEFLEVCEVKYDVIYMDQVLEHFTLEEAEKIIPLIMKRLKPSGVFLNSMPNANGYYNTPSNRYNDITHKIIYNKQSFTQLLKVLGIYNFTFRNDYIGRNWLQNIVHKCYLKLFELHLKLLGFAKWKFYTHTLNTSIRK